MSDNENPVSANQTQVTENLPVPAASPSLVEWEQKERAYRENIKAALENNKTALFETFAASGITSVAVTFDGYGDSGQIESVEAKNGDDPIALPDVRVELWQADWESPGIGRRSCTIHEAIEELCYALLAQTHCGWENNDGAYGDFTFDTAARTITLDYNERYTESENYTHEF